MTVEAATFISNLVPANPADSDDRKEGAEHLRLLKTILQAQFPNFTTTAVNLTPAYLNELHQWLGSALAAANKLRLFQGDRASTLLGVEITAASSGISLQFKNAAGANRGSAVILDENTISGILADIVALEATAVEMGGASGTGVGGYAPAQVAGDARKYLTGDKDWELPARSLLATKTLSGASEAIFKSTDGFDAAKWCAYEFEITLLPSVDGADLQCTFSTNDGATWETGATDYHWLSNYVSGAGGSVGSGNTAYIQLVDDIGNAAGRQVNGTVKIFSNGAGVRGTELLSDVVRKNTSGTTVMEKSTGYYAPSTAITAYRFAMSSGTMTGSMRIFGIAKTT